MDLDIDIVELVPFVPPPATALREVAYRSTAWLPCETDQLRALFAQDASLDEISERLGRPRFGVVDRLYRLGLRRHSSTPWTEWDDAELAKRYASETAAQLAQDLGRTPSAVFARAALLGLTEPSEPDWTEWEEAQVRAGYAQGVPVAQLATLIGRSYCALNTFACRMGIRHASHPDDWSLEEVARALELANDGLRYLAIIETLVDEGYPRRSKAGLGPKLRAMGYGRGWGRAWTAEEEALLRHAYATGASLTPLRERLGRSRAAIAWKSKDLGLQGTHHIKAGWRTEPPWSDEETQLLRDNYGKRRAREVAKLIGRPLRAIYSRAFSLGLKDDWMRAFSPDEDRAIGIGWRQGISIPDLAIAMARDPAVVHKRAKRIGFVFSDPNRPVKTTRPRREGRTVPTLQQILEREVA